MPVHTEPKQIHLDLTQARKTTTKPRGGLPSPTTKVAEAYLNAVENGGSEAKANVVLRRPNGKEMDTVLRAARVTNSNKRHSGSFSAAPCSKQMSRLSDQSIQSDSSSEQTPPLFQNDPNLEKQIRTSPVPMHGEADLQPSTSQK